MACPASRSLAPDLILIFGVVETTLSLTLILASQSLPHVRPTKLKALPLSLLVRLLTTTISSAFDRGNFLRMMPQLSANPIPTMQFMAALSRLTAVLLGVLVNSPKGGLTEAHESLETFRDISSQVERHWMASKLSVIQNEESMGDHIFPPLPCVISLGPLNSPRDKGHL